MKKLFSILMLTSLLLISCGDNEQEQPRKTETKQARTQQGTPNAKSKPILVEQEVGYRLQPDKRFLAAVAETYNFITGKSNSKATAVFVDGQWIIRHGDLTVGSVPELPNFVDFMSILTNWAATLRAKHPFTQTAGIDQSRLSKAKTKLKLFMAPDTKSALQELNALWREGLRNPEVIQEATRGLIWLTLQSIDTTGMDNGLPAKSLAMLAIAKTLSGSDTLVVEEALLADEMHYSAHARTTIAQLPDNPIYFYITRDYDKFNDLAARPGASPLMHYLGLKHLAERHDIESWSNWLKKYYQDDRYVLYVLKTGLDMNRFSFNRFLADFLPKVVLLHAAMENRHIEFHGTMIRAIVKAAAPTPNPNRISSGVTIAGLINNIIGLDKSGMTRKLEEDLAKLSDKYQGPFLDTALMRGYYESYFYTCLRAQGLFYLDALSSVDMVREFAAEFNNVDNKKAQEFTQWYTGLAEVKTARGDHRVLHQYITEANEFGSPLFIRSFEELKGQLPVADPKTFTVIRQVVAKMDSRPTDRLHLGDLAFASLMDLKLTEQMIGSGITVDPTNSMVQRIWFAGFQRDLTTLREIVDNPAIQPEDRVRAINRLAKIDENNPDIISSYAKLLQDRPRDWKVSKSFVDFLIKIEEYEQARRVALDWLQKEVPTLGLERTVMANAVAKTFYEQENYKEGLAYIVPYVGGMQAGSMIIAAKCMAKLGRHQDSETLFKRMVVRYPDSLVCRIEYVNYLWQSGEHKRAAGMLKEWKYPISISDWRFKVGQALSDTLTGDDEAIRGAFNALLDAGISHWNLAEILNTLSHADNDELAFELNNRLSAPGMGNLVFIIDGYLYLKRARGEQEALAWVNSKIPANMHNMSSMMIFSEGQYDLLWNVIKDPEKGQHGDFVWLMRAAGHMKSGNADNERRKKLVAFFSRNDQTYYQQIGRFLLDLDSGENLWAQAVNANKRCELAYYFAVKAQGQGDYARASDWYQTAVETGMKKMGEYRWSYNELYRWYSKGISLENIKKESK